MASPQRYHFTRTQNCGTGGEPQALAAQIMRRVSYQMLQRFAAQAG